MNREEEKEYWPRLINELNEKFTLEYLAREFGVSERQVSNWKKGERPLGFKAIKIYLFHGKRCITLQETGTAVHSNFPAKA